LAQVTTIFEGVGQVYQVPEAQFAAYTAIAGSSPAFVFQFIDAMSRAAVRQGIPKALATQIAAQAVAGSGALALAEGGNPWDLVDKVSSPGGTTVEGVLKLEELGFYNAVVQAVDAVIEKDAKLK
jgi:pyrroline-5-carboxylate reductase